MQKTHVTADDGVRIPVTTAGDGMPLVCIHGWTGSFMDWTPLIDRLSDRFRIIGWDARPYVHGGDTGIQRMARDLHNLLDHFGLDQAVLMGHSMGALTLWEFIRQFGTERAKALCFIDQSPCLINRDDWSNGLWGKLTPAMSEQFIADLRKNFADTVVDLIAHSRVDEQGNCALPKELLEARRKRLQELQPAPWIDAWASFVGNDYRPELGKIDVPTFLAYGARSHYYGPAVAEYVFRNIPTSEMVLYPQASHAPHIEALDQFVDDFNRFVDHSLATTA